MSRGNRREALFLNDDDRHRFLGRVAELPDRYGLELHAFVLMTNHYHLLLRTPEPNLNHAIHWLNVAYSTWFNWAHQQVGHVFQGRYKAVMIQEATGVCEVARYLHLNPVRINGLGLGKVAQRQAKVLGCDDPGGELVARRLELLKSYPWSSWRVYLRAKPRPQWLETDLIRSGCGGRSAAAQRGALRTYTEAPVRQGHLESPWERLVGGFVLGSEEYAKELLEQAKANSEEQTEARRLHRVGTVPWQALVTAAEAELGESWSQMLTRHGAWGRDAVFYAATRYAGHRLAEVVMQAPGLSYQAAAQGVRRFRLGLDKDPNKRRFLSRLKRHLSII